MEAKQIQKKLTRAKSCLEALNTKGQNYKTVLMEVGSREALLAWIKHLEEQINDNER